MITDRNLKLRFEKCSTDKAYGRERILYSHNNTLIPLSSTDSLIEASNSKNTEKLLQIIKAKDEYIKKILVRNRELENKVSRLTMKVTMLNSTKCKSETNSEIRKSLCNKNFKILASKNIIHRSNISEIMKIDSVFRSTHMLPFSQKNIALTLSQSSTKHKDNSYEKSVLYHSRENNGRILHNRNQSPKISMTLQYKKLNDKIEGSHSSQKLI